MARKNKNRRRGGGGGGEGGIGPGPSSTVSLRVPRLKEFVLGESLKRPGFVSCGESYDVKANYFKPSSYNENLYRYDVCINPRATSPGVSRAVMRQLVTMYGQSRLGGRLPAYDGKTRLYTSGLFPFTSESFQVTLHDQEDGLAGEQASQRHQSTFLVMIKLHATLSGGIDNEEFCQAFNTVLHELSTGRYYPVGRSFYSPRIGEGLKNCCGFHQNIQCTQMGISLNIDISYRSFIKPLPVISFVAQLLSRDFTDGPFNFTEQLMINKAVSDIKVNVTLEGNMHKKYHITGLTSQVASKLFFPVDDDGTKKAVVQYFKDKYGYNIQLDLPCFKVGDQQSPTYLPIEVCEIADGQQISNLLNVTFQHPFDREKTILQIVNPYNGDPYAKEFGVTFENKLTIIKGRVLPPPMKMVDGGAVNTWTCINFASDITHAAAVAFCDELAVMCLVSGMNFRGDPVLPVVNARPKYVESALKKHHKRVMKILRPQGKELDLLIVILPDNNGTLYGDIKRICETDIGLVSQCCLAKHVLPMKPRFLTNIALKINAKVGGRNTVLVDAVERNLPRVGNTPTIIFGADVSHPRPGEGPYSPSIAAVVASQDWPEVTKYAGSVRPQAHREEIIQCLFDKNDCRSGCIPGGMIKEHLITFMRKTGHIPGRIIFYRDVVSKEKLNQVLEHELSAIKKACASVDPIYNPQVTIIMVQRRHHTRLFSGNYGTGGTVFRSGNVLPGTVVDREICHPTDFDFYLCSHAGTKGVSRPVRYHVLWDENSFTANAIQSLTNHLCYTYARSTSSVSVVPPVYYAHLLASRARLYIKPGDTGELSFPEIKDNVKNSGMFFC
ncbi:hypothetical protein ACQJBY_062575 [Aegilops geniculata]